MGARRYGIYLRVFTSISNEWAQRTSEISNVNTRRYIPYLQASMYYSLYYINILITAFLMIFRRFPTTFRRFPKIFEIFPKTRRTFPNIFREFPKFSEDVRRLPKTFEEDSKLFRWHTNEFKYNLRDKPDVSEIIDIFTCEIIVILHVEIYGFSQWQKSW